MMSPLRRSTYATPFVYTCACGFGTLKGCASVLKTQSSRLMRSGGEKMR